MNEAQRAVGWGRGAWFLGVLALANLVHYAQRNVLPPVYADLRARFGFSDASLGVLGWSFFAAHGLATPLAGWLGDRVDRRRLVASGLVLAALGALLGPLVSSLWALALTRAVVGAGTAVVVPVVNAMIAERYDGAKKASAISIFNLGILLGGFGGFLGGDQLGFPRAWYVLGALSLITALMVTVLPARKPEDQSRLSSTSIGTMRSVWMRKPLRWLIGAATCMAFAAGGYLAWFLDFLEKDKGLSREAATQVFGISFFAAVAGVLVGGRWADALVKKRADGRLVVIRIGMAMTAPVSLAWLYAPTGATLVVASFAAMFFVSWYHSPMAATVDDLAPGHLQATTQALVVCAMHFLGTGPASFIVGRLAKEVGLTRALWLPTAMVVVAAGCTWGAQRAIDFERRRLGV